MLLNISENVTKIPGNAIKHFGECRQTFGRMSLNILRNVAEHSGECRQIFRGISSNIPGNVKEDDYWAESHLES